jgi:hypothetical protein
VLFYSGRVDPKIFGRGDPVQLFSNRERQSIEALKPALDLDARCGADTFRGCGE